MSLIPDSEKKKLSEIFQNNLKEDVEIIFIEGNTPECVFCKEIKELLGELKSTSDKIKYEIHDLNSDTAKKYGIDKAPVLFFKKKPNIRFLGMPSGHEFTTLVDDIIHISKNSADIKYSTAKALSGIKDKVHIMIFVTPTCPYCPTTVRMAHMFSMFKDNIVSEMIEAIEYKDLADKWGVMAVPKVVINEKVEFEGAYPEEAFVEKILEAVRK